MQTKKFTILETKAAGDSGEFTALVSVFGNVDYAGDRMVHGAFKRTLKNWQKSGDPIPVILSHDWENVMSHIGVADPNQAKETSKGLLIKGTLDVEDNPVAKQVHKLMKRRSLKEFSFGYTVPEGGEEVADDGAMDVMDVDLIEVGPTLKGMNDKTELLDVKSALGVEEDKTGTRSKDADDLRRRTFEGATKKAATPVTAADNALAADLATATERLGETVEENEALKAQLAQAKTELEERDQELRQEKTPSEEVLRRRLANEKLVENDGSTGDIENAELEALRTELAEAKSEAETLREQVAQAPSEEVLRRQLANERLSGVETNVVEEFEKASEELRKALAENELLREKVDESTAQAAEALAELAEAKRPSEEELRRRTAEQRLGDIEPVEKAEVELPDGEMDIAIKAVWTTAYINDLPDSAFLYVESGGEKDGDGKTKPRSLRHFPVRDSEGSLDLPHLRNALSRIPQSNLPQDVKDRLTAKCERLLANANKTLTLDETRIEDGADEEPASAKSSSPQDSLRKRSDQVALEVARGDLREDIELEPDPEPPVIDEAALRRRAFDLMLEIRG